MACPKQPLPSTSPWMRSEGRKMRWGRETTRSDSERPMSFLCEAGDPKEVEQGDLSMLQLRLSRKRRGHHQGLLHTQNHTAGFLG